jgi:hypothetical protein
MIIEFPVLFHFIVQGLSIDVQKFGRFALVKIDLLQGLQNHLIFRIDARFLQREI